MESAEMHLLDVPYGAGSPFFGLMSPTIVCGPGSPSVYNTSQDKLHILWQEKVGNFETMTDAELKSNRLPIARIKQIMKTVTGLRDNLLVASEVPALLAKASEMLILHLTSFAWEHTSLNRRRTLQHADLMAAIDKNETFNFLNGLFSNSVDKNMEYETESVQPSPQDGYSEQSDVYYIRRPVPPCDMRSPPCDMRSPPCDMRSPPCDMRSPPSMTGGASPYDVFNPYLPTGGNPPNNTQTVGQKRLLLSPGVDRSPNSMQTQYYNAYAQQPDGSLRCLPMQRYHMIGRSEGMGGEGGVGSTMYDGNRIGKLPLHQHGSPSKSINRSNENFNAQDDGNAMMNLTSNNKSDPYDFRYQLSNGR